MRLYRTGLAARYLLPPDRDLGVLILGKRDQCEKSGTEALRNKAGTGTLECCGEPMKVKEAKPLQSSD
jgi:hypothetical protein